MFKEGVFRKGSVTVESPPLQSSCDNGEYYYSGICCKKCPAGTHVDEHCSAAHTLGHCVACTAGEDYTAYENGLDKCLLCAQCKSGTTMVKDCTVKSNTECRCNDGYYCPPYCEECLRCKTKCPEGQVVVQNCNATVDMECGLPTTGTSHLDGLQILYIFLSLLISVVICSLILYKKCCVPRRKEEKGVENHLSSDSTDDLLPSRKNSNTNPLLTESQEVQPSLSDPVSVSSCSGLPESFSVPLSSTEDTSSSGTAPLLRLTDKPVTHNTQSNLKVLPSITECSAAVKPSHDELSEICGELPSKMRVPDWMTLMRNTGLSDNDRDIIKYDYPFDTREQMHRMLTKLCERFGTEDALCKLLNGLQQMNLTHIYENLLNELLSKNIRIVEDEGKCIYLVKNAEQNV
ncbi:tumor necrosis factor receptor superfamily member 10B-like isoform X2 [Sphaerodactylus townsendi]|uniref:tumor necrosis factor receptor superfamily member 10B-like isoform X2 n=1 Tax=Sphaerodactylus townsendi TaxID=933632 RepID=UPI002025E228|nr:tumor necrosis factor receptor superfamily member 10B-like isoform X2 [Sphaerodactylus townsendi]